MRAARFLILCSLLLLASCGDLLEPAAAVANGKKITVDEIEAIVQGYEATPEFDQLAGRGDARSILRQFEQTRLSQLVRRAVLQPKAEQLGIEVTQQEVSGRLDRIKSDFESEDAFEKALRDQGLTIDYLHELIYDSLLEEELRAKVTADARPSEEELSAYYDEHLNDYRQTRAQHILVESGNLAQSLVARLRAAPEKEVDELFAKLAKKYSTDPSNANKGGDLGYFSSGQFVEPFEKAANPLAIGEISDPVQTQFGFHIIRVTGRRIAPFEEVRGQIEQKIATQAVDEAWQAWVIAAYEAADIRINPRYGELDLETQQIANPTAQDIPGADESAATPTPTPPG